MTDAAGNRRPITRIKALLGVTLIAPLLVFIGAVGSGADVIDWRVGYDLLTLKLGWYAAMVGGLAALAAVILAFRDLRRAGPFALVAVVVAALTLGLFIRHFMVMGDDAPKPDATTNLADPPGYSSQIMATRTADGAVPVDQWRDFQAMCPVGGSLPTQVAPGAAAWALERAGFAVLGSGVGRADGASESFWFGFTHDATIRIRPGQTDIRVTAREDRDDGGEACRLARRIKEALQTSR